MARRESATRSGIQAARGTAAAARGQQRDHSAIAIVAELSYHALAENSRHSATGAALAHHRRVRYHEQIRKSVVQCRSKHATSASAPQAGAAKLVGQSLLHAARAGVQLPPVKTCL